METDLVLRNYSPCTIQSYLRCARKLAAFYMRSPQDLGEDEVRAFLRHLHEGAGLGPSSVKMHTAALKHLYAVILERPEVTDRIPYPKVPRVRREVLTAEEVSRLLRATTHPKFRAIFTTAYAGGLRTMEVLALQTRDVDAARKVLHIRCGKVSRTGQTDRCQLGQTDRPSGQHSGADPGRFSMTHSAMNAGGDLGNESSLPPARAR